MKLKFLFIALPVVVLFGAFFVLNNSIAADAPTLSGSAISGTQNGTSRLVTCGRTGQNMCTLCDIIKGMNNIIEYLEVISVGVALLVMTIGGVMYIVSAGDSGLAESGKNAVKNALIGFAIVFVAYLVVNTTINYLGTRKDPVTGKTTFGMKITSWGEFDCSAQDRGGE